MAEFFLNFDKSGNREPTGLIDNQSGCSIEHTDSSTAYQGISRPKPAHYIKLVNGTLSPQHRYWDLKVNEDFNALTLEEASVIIVLGQIRIRDFQNYQQSRQQQ